MSTEDISRVLSYLEALAEGEELHISSHTHSQPGPICTTPQQSRAVEVDTTANALTAKKRECDKLQATIEAANEKVDKAESELLELRAANEHLRTRTVELTGSLEVKNAQLQQFRTSNVELKAQLAELKRRSETLKAVEGRWKNELAVCQTKFSASESKTAALEKEVADLQSTATCAINAHQELSQAYEALLAKGDVFKAKLHTKAIEVTEAKAHQKVWEEHSHGIQQYQAQLDESIAAVRQQVESNHHTAKEASELLRTLLQEAALLQDSSQNIVKKGCDVFFCPQAASLQVPFLKESSRAEVEAMKLFEQAEGAVNDLDAGEDDASSATFCTENALPQLYADLKELLRGNDAGAHAPPTSGSILEHSQWKEVNGLIDRQFHLEEYIASLECQVHSAGKFFSTPQSQGSAFPWIKALVDGTASGGLPGTARHSTEREDVDAARPKKRRLVFASAPGEELSPAAALLTSSALKEKPIRCDECDEFIDCTSLCETVCCSSCSVTLRHRRCHTEDGGLSLLCLKCRKSERKESDASAAPTSDAPRPAKPRRVLVFNPSSLSI